MTKHTTCQPCEGSVPEPDPQVPTAADEELARLAWGIAHPARVLILRLLVARAGCVCGELVGQMTLAQSTVSQHLKILKEAGLVRGEVDGPRVCYCIDPAGLARLRELLGGL